jgi:hypothetical protein
MNKTRRFKRKGQRGGSHDTEFLVKHKHNMDTIRKALDDNGRYTLNADNVHYFINEQYTPIRKQAARDLVENTVYITLRETFLIVEQLVIKIYAQLGGVTPYMFVSLPKKSFYMLSCIAVHYIKKHKYAMPIFVKDLNIFNQPLPAPLIIIDDASYSGSQLSQILTLDIYDICLSNKIPFPTVFVGLTALNTKSLNLLSGVDVKLDTSDGYQIIEQPSPFNIVYLKERLYPSLIEKIGIERYFNINLFFNPWLSHSTNIGLYFDYKMADNVSTYKRTYMYGPIVPYDYDFPLFKMFRNTCMLELDELPPEMDKTKLHEQHTILDDFNRENPKCVIKLDNYGYYNEIDIKNFLIDKAFLSEKKFKEQNVGKIRVKPGIQFYPFINKCLRLPKLKEIIQNSSVINFEYLAFHIDERNQQTGSLEDLEYEGRLNGYTEDEAHEVIRMLESHRCPVSFYKEGPLRLL